MIVRWSRVLPVALIVIAIAAFKMHDKPGPLGTDEGLPRVLLVADLSEADSADACGEIIHSVRAARERGIQVQELPPDSGSDMLRRYHILTTPTVLILDRSGQVVLRFEGEDRETVVSIRSQLAQLH